MSQVKTKFIADNAVTGIKMRLDNNEAFRARNAADTGDVTLFALDPSDTFTLLSSLSPSSDNTLSLGAFGALHWLAVNTYAVQSSGPIAVNGQTITMTTTSAGNIQMNIDTTGVLDLTNHSIINVADPVNPNDAVNKLYADSLSAGLSPKAPVRVATTADLGLTYATTPSNGQFSGAAPLLQYTFQVTAANATAGDTYTNNGNTYTVVNTITGGTTLVTTGAASGQTITGSTLTKSGGAGDATITFSSFGEGFVIDGVMLTDQNRVLVKDQADPKQNGIYVYDAVAGTLTRSGDMNGTPPTDVAGGDYTFIQAGSMWAGFGFNVIWDGQITLNTDPVNWGEFSGGTNFANRDLSNLIPTNINQSLITNLSNTFDLGSTAFLWNNLYANASLDASGVQSVGFISRVLTDSSGITSVDWQNKQLANSSGPSLDWSNGSLLAPLRPFVYTNGSGELSTANAAEADLLIATNNPAWVALAVDTNSGQVTILTGATTGTGVSGSILAQTGTSVDGASGDVILNIGTPSGTGVKGKIRFQDGSEGTAGQVWTSTDVNGGGHWQATSATSTWAKETFTLSPTDISNGFVTLGNTPIANSMNLSSDGLVAVEGVDYSLAGTQLNFSSFTPTLSSGDVLNAQYQF